MSVLAALRTEQSRDRSRVFDRKYAVHLEARGTLGLAMTGRRWALVFVEMLGVGRRSLLALRRG